MSASFETILEKYLDKGLSRYLNDVESMAFLEETLKDVLADVGVPVTAIRCCTWFLPRALHWLEQELRGKRSWFGAITGRAIMQTLENLPCSEKIAAQLDPALGKFLEGIEAREACEAFRRGELSPAALDFANNLPRDLKWHVEQLGAIRNLEAMLRDLVPQPPLRFHVQDLTDDNRFIYRSRSVPFVGRDQEMAKLKEFLENPKLFSWWLVSGPAGSGKSRLGFEFCLRRASGAWRAGFLPKSPEKLKQWCNAQAWRPDTPTLLIADYPHMAAEVLHEIALDLAHSDKLNCPVRLLLLERDAEGPWKEKFLSGSERGDLLECTHSASALELPSLDGQEQHLWGILKAFIEREGGNLPDKAQALEKLREIDPLGRPLFAMFMGDALARHSNLRAWDRDRLLKNVLTREKERWTACGLQEKPDFDLLALATMTGGLSKEKLSLPSLSPLLPELWDQFPQRFRQMGGGSQEWIPKLEPDILGELFVLDLVERDPCRSTLAGQLRAAAWGCDAEGMFSFLTRSGQNHPQHPCLLGLAKSQGVEGAGRIYWAMAGVNLVEAYGDAKELSSALNIYRELEALAKDHDEPPLRKLQALAGVNLVNGNLKAQDLPAALGIYRELEALAGQHDEQPLREWQAKTGFNLVDGYLKDQAFPSALGIYRELAALARQHDEQPLRLEQAKAALNLVTLVGQAHDLLSALNIYRELAALAKDHEEPPLRELQAKAGVNLLFAYDDAHDLPSALGLYRELAALAGQHKEPPLRDLQAQAAFNLVTGYLKDQALPSALYIYRELAALAGQHKEPPLREWQARAGTNLVFVYGSLDVPSALVIYRELEALAGLHDTPPLREWQAKAGVNLVNGYLKAHDLPAALGIYRELAALAGEHDEPPLREPYARATHRLCKFLKNAGKTDEAHAMCGTLKALAETHPAEQELADLLALAKKDLCG